MEPNNHKKNVLISTLYPLGGNYGGIIQAFALQKYLNDLGFNSVTINSDRPFALTRSYLRQARYLTKKLLRKNPGAKPLSRKSERTKQANTRNFVSEHITTIDLFHLSKSARKKLLGNLDAIVVGSDQVWRGGYADVKKQLLDYATDLSIPKISYAASFGGDELIGYSSGLKHKTAKLAKSFSAISVREASGIELCQKEWDASAEFHIDPTLLLPREVYQTLIETKTIQNGAENSGLFCYVLDPNPWINNLTLNVSKQLNLNQFSIQPETNTLHNHLNMLPSVPEWLDSFSRSDFVITDSFHGTVFSIIFNKPFLVVGNTKRGLSRFESILSLFNLESRLVSDGTQVDVHGLAPIDWDTVNAKITRERQRSLEYLTANLPSL